MPLIPQKRFTDREGPRCVLLEKLTTPQTPDEYRLLTFYGVGGQGKSELSRYFQDLAPDHENRTFSEWAKEQVTLPAYRFALLDFGFSEDRNPAEALMKLRSSLADAKIDCFHFDLAFSYYLAKASPGVTMREKYPNLFSSEHGLFYDLFSLGGSLISELTISIPLVIIGALGRYAQRHKNKRTDWYNGKGKELEAQLKLLDQQKLLDELPRCLGYDLDAALAKPETPRLVFVFDTYEALWEGVSQYGPGTQMVDSWVRDLVSACPGALFIFFGRERLKWDAASKPYKGRNYAAMLEDNQYSLDGLPESDADLFLKTAGIWQPQIRRAIIASSAGLPFYLDLQLEMYKKLSEEGTPSPEDFGKYESDVIENFLRRLNDHQKNALYVLAQERQFDEALFELLKEKFFSGFPISFSQFAQHSFVREVQGQFVMHQLMREHLVDYLRSEEPERFKAVHGFLFEHYDGQAKVEDIKAISPIQEAALVEAAYHKSLAAEMSFNDWLRERAAPFLQAARYRLLEPLHRQALEISKRSPGEAHLNQAAALNNLAFLLTRTDGYEEAEELYSRATEVFKESPLGKKHPYYVTCLNNLATFLTNLRRFSEAEPFLYEAIDTIEQVHSEKHPAYPSLLHNLANWLYQTKRYAKAEPLFHKAISIIKQNLDEGYLIDAAYEKYAASLGLLGRTLCKMSRYEEAYQYLDQAIKFDKQELSEEHPLYAVHLSYLAELFYETDRRAEAKLLCNQAIEILRKRLGDTHSYTQDVMKNCQNINDGIL